jgi:hypothetical protein
VLLALLALAAPLPAFAISDQASQPVSAAPGPAAITVSTSLDSCGVLDDGVVCKIDVSFNEIPTADSYSATVTRADGSVIDYGGVGPGGTSLWVPYVGSGNYSVTITAYGEPESPNDPDGHGDVIATGYSRSGDKGKHKPRSAGDHATGAQTSVTVRNADAQGNPTADGVASSEVGTSAAATTTCTTTTTTTPAPPPPTPPEEPPADLDPDNPDEDADGIPDDQERITYEQQMAEYEAALAAQQAPPPAPAC